MYELTPGFPERIAASRNFAPPGNTVLSAMRVPSPLSVTLPRLAQDENASLSMYYTLAGMVMLSISVQLWNAYSPIVVTKSGMVTFLSNVQL